ncbi:TPA: hypothetical protein UM046_003319 [Stenotrophomonas maltophilia]|uniref:hypothetical protein n=1 Tax=Stenotrophomonas maltophilia TaxID=40324 RepID=UPI0015DCBC77|nr:hypothetical protein [Stenotrophomonas maltophilia]MBW8776727.1 hypothetical protein [Stenotrophomonas sp.]QDL27589.1 hypothetical protein EGM71_07430 [Stenotrophomonas maltophilia]HEL3785524.1 hypothetical protein [Stenotrophomonas maltophilia]
MIKTTLKTVMLLGMAVTGLAFAAGTCEFCTLKYEQCLRTSQGPLGKTSEQCLAEYKLCREMDCPSP